MTFSVSDLFLVRKENPQQWLDGKTTADKVYTSGLFPGDFFDREQDIVTAESMATLMLYSVFGSVLKETDIVRDDNSLFSRYARTLVSRMERGEDTGLAHRDVMPMWEMLDKKEQRKAAQILIDACDNLVDFPSVEKFNVAYSMREADVDAGDFYIPILIPAVVSIRSGLAVIVPSITGSNYHHSAYNHLSYPYGQDISQVHVWNIPESKVEKVEEDLFSMHVAQKNKKLLKY